MIYGNLTLNFIKTKFLLTVQNANPHQRVYFKEMEFIKEDLQLILN